MQHAKATLEHLHKRVVYLTTALLWTSGAIWMYLSETDPSRPLWLKLHGAAAMIFLIIFGTLLIRHVPAGWRQNHQRPSGVSLIAGCGVLMATGWALYYVGGEGIRPWISKAHSFIGLALPLIILVHARGNLTKQ